MRVIIGSIMHEANTFSKIRTDLAAFKRMELLLGDEIVDYHTNRKTEIGGILYAFRDKNVEVIPTISASAQPSGIVYSSTAEFLKETLLIHIEKNQNADAILLVLHGAMVTEGIDDFEGVLLKEIREIVGNEICIGLTLDLHANVSTLMGNNVDFIIGYRTHPHTDQWMIGQRAANMISYLMKKRSKATTTMKKLPMILPAETSLMPRTKLLEKIYEIEKDDEILTASFFLGYPWADIDIIGPSVVVTTNNNLELAERKADELASLMWKLKNNFALPISSIDVAINEALHFTEKPVILCDMGDTLYGGAGGDVPALLLEVIRTKTKNAVLTAIVDPDSVQKAIQVGQGKEILLDIGGKLDQENGRPVRIKGKIKLITSEDSVRKSMLSLYKDKKVSSFEDALARESMCGLNKDRRGFLAVIEIEGKNEIVLIENKMQVFMPSFLYSLGIDPKKKKIVIVKDGIAPVLTYEKIAKKIIFVDSPGWCSQNFNSINYAHVPRPIFPLDDVIYQCS